MHLSDIPDILRRAAFALLAAPALLLLVTAGTAQATGTGLSIHHLLPGNGAVLRTAPDHVEIMFDAEPVSGGVDVAVAPDDTGRLIDLPGRPLVDGPVVVQPLPALAPGRYTVGVQVLDRAGHLSRGTFGFTVDPAAPAAEPAAAPGSTDLAWLIPAAGTALLLPAAMLARRRRTRR